MKTTKTTSMRKLEVWFNDGSTLVRFSDKYEWVVKDTYLVVTSHDREMSTVYPWNNIVSAEESPLDETN
jgi:hypothetical protein